MINKHGSIKVTNKKDKKQNMLILDGVIVMPLDLSKYFIEDLKDLLKSYRVAANLQEMKNGK
jgi:hypothetical protein